MDRQADNIGDTDRWEDPRDTFGGETDMDLCGKRHQHWTTQFGWTTMSGCKVVHDHKDKHAPRPKGWRDLTSWPGIPYPEDAPQRANIGNWDELITPENLLKALAMAHGRLVVQSRDLWNASVFGLDIQVEFAGLTIALGAPVVEDRETESEGRQDVQPDRDGP